MRQQYGIHVVIFQEKKSQFTLISKLTGDSWLADWLATSERKFAMSYLCKTETTHEGATQGRIGMYRSIEIFTSTSGPFTYSVAQNYVYNFYVLIGGQSYFKHEFIFLKLTRPATNFNRPTEISSVARLTNPALVRSPLKSEHTVVARQWPNWGSVASRSKKNFQFFCPSAIRVATRGHHWRPPKKGPKKCPVK